MTTLVTGAGGFLGRALVARMLASGARDLRLLVRSDKARAHVNAIAAQHPSARLDIRVGNLLSPGVAAGAVEGVDTIYHLAAAMSGAPADMFLHTVVASRSLLDAIGPARVRVVLVSSFAVYGVAALPRGALVDERTPLETSPARRDVYAQAKLRQERLFRERQERQSFELVVVRPGVIYGTGGGPAFSSRVGLSLFGLFLHLGGDNALPLTYVENCADAVATAGGHPSAAGEAYNVHDDDLPTCRDYLRAYRANVAPVRTLTVPYPALVALSHAVERYHRWSRGQLPAIFTPYKTATSWGGNRFDNRKLKSLGWTPRIPTAEGLSRTFASLAATRTTA